jgi:hypothetical protein
MGQEYRKKTKNVPWHEAKIGGFQEGGGGKVI